MRKSKLVTLFVLVSVLVTMLGVTGIASANGNDKITICHFPPGNPDNPQTIEISPNAWDAHEAHGDHLGACTPDDFPDDDDDGDDDGDDEVCEWNESIPADSDDCVPPDDDDDDDEGEVCEWNESIPADDPECVPPGDDDDTPDDGNVGGGNVAAEAPAPALIQITVWPDTFQVAELTGFTWTIDGNPIFSDTNHNGVMDNGESLVVTAVELRNRPVCGDPAPNVPNQPMSRLVLGMTLEDIPNGDLDAFLSRFEAQINGVPVEWGWYDIGGEFAPCVPAFDGAVQQRQNGEVVLRFP